MAGTKKTPRPPAGDRREASDSHLASLEASMESYRGISRQAEQTLADLRGREALIRAEGHQPPNHSVVESTLTLGAVVSLKEHFESLRVADFRFYEERDRRYTEVNIEREKALKIKETADLAALSLAREIQDYKDEKANNLRTQIEAERGTYATKDDVRVLAEKFEAMVKPIAEWVQNQQGGSAQRSETQTTTRWDTRQQSQHSEWQIGVFITVGIAVGGVILKALGIIHLP